MRKTVFSAINAKNSFRSKKTVFRSKKSKKQVVGLKKRVIDVKKVKKLLIRESFQRYLEK